MNHELDEAAPRWMGFLLKAAALHNALGCVTVLLLPVALFEWIGLKPPAFPALIQCMGLVVGVFGLGFWCASTAPLRHWPVILMAFVLRLLVPVGFIIAALRGEFPWSMGWVFLVNDLAWCFPFALMLWAARKTHACPGLARA